MSPVPPPVPVLASAAPARDRLQRPRIRPHGPAPGGASIDRFPGIATVPAREEKR